MTRPGERLRRLAIRNCSAEQVDRVIDPAIADLQWEHAEAVNVGATWRARWLQARAIATFWRVIPGAWIASGQDDGALRRVFVSVSGWALVATVALIWPVLRSASIPGVFAESGRRKVLFAVLLVPQALPVGAAVGLAVGVTLAMRSARPARRTRRLVLIAASVMAVMMLLNLGWGVPAANQAFRTAVSGRVPMRGAPELTLPELRDAAIRQTRGEPVAEILPPPGHRLLAFEYWGRWAMITSPIVLTLFAIAVAPFIQSSLVAIAVGSLAIAVFYAIWTATGVAATGWWSAAVAAWTPNLLILVGALVFHAIGRRDAVLFPS